MKPTPYGRLTAALVLFSITLGPLAADAATSAWVVDQFFRLVRLTTDGLMLWELLFDQSDSVGVDPRDGSSWVPQYGVRPPPTFALTNEMLEIGAGGQIIRRVVGDAGLPAIDSTDGSVWIGASDLVKLDASGRELLRKSGPFFPASIAVDTRDSSVWFGTRGSFPTPAQLVKVDRLGNELFRQIVRGWFSDATQQIAIDPRDGSVWYVQGLLGTVVKRSAQGTVLGTVPGFDIPVSVDVDPGDGSAWVANFSQTNRSTVVKLDRCGRELLRKSLDARVHMARVNPDDGSVWVGVDGAVVILSSTGEDRARLEGFTTPMAIVIARVAEDPTMLDSFTRFTGGSVATSTLPVCPLETEVARLMIIGLGGIDLGDNAAVTGVIASDATVTIGKTATVRGNVFGNALDLSENAHIEGNVSARVINTRKNATITGTQSNQVTLPLAESFAIVENIQGVERVIVPKRARKQLQPGRFLSIQAEESAEIRMAGGQYDVSEMRIGKQARLIFEGPCTINVVDKLSVGERAVFASTERLTADDIRINYGGAADAVFGKAIRGTFRLMAPKALIRLGERGVYAGQIWGQRVQIGNAVQIQTSD